MVTRISIFYKIIFIGSYLPTQAVSSIYRATVVGTFDDPYNIIIH